MKKRNPFDASLPGGLGFPAGFGGVNAGPTTSHLQMALKEQMAAKLASSLKGPMGEERKAAPVKPSTEGEPK